MMAAVQINSEPSHLGPMVRKLAYWVDLDASDRAALLALPHRVKTLGHNQYVVREGDRAQYSCVMLAGFSVRQKIVAGGLRQIVAIHMKGDLVDLQNSLVKVADHSVQMLTVGEIAMVPLEEIVRIAFERPAIGKAMWIDTVVEASIAREWVANVGQRDARTRIAHLLCEVALRLKLAGIDVGQGYDLPMTQEQLADATGLTAVHVNRMIKLLEAEGLISRTTPRAITVGDWKMLARAGDFDTGYLHLHEDEPALA